MWWMRCEDDKSVLCSSLRFVALSSIPKVDLRDADQLGTFAAGMVLLLNFWGAKRCGLSTDFQKEMTDIKKCIDVLGAIGKR